ncbi:DNA-processing protein DprA [Pseudomonas alkylphenolica]|uniref:DNA-processing protein DprA n=1 Tax=Pseudomonas alkylphenolica TaxID=237609 RepID=UPI00315DC28C
MRAEYFSQLMALVLKKQSIPNDRISSFLKANLSDLSVANGFPEVSDIFSSFFVNLPPLSSQEWDDARRSHEKNTAHGISMLCFGDERYPHYLASLTDAPPVLFLKGSFSALTSLPGVAIVGAREATEPGKEIARRIAKFMSESGWPVVSGLALGIDAAAHQGALDAGGITIAVLAGGVDKPNPAANIKLGHSILEAGGAWVSEHPVGTPPRKHHFVPRNRIQVGLSAGSIIVEAKMRSGSITQARFCVNENRPLFSVVPSSSDNPLGLNSEGTLHMVEELGAIPIKSKADYFLVQRLLEESKKNLVEGLGLFGRGSAQLI